jgi:hypothetical protein
MCLAHILSVIHSRVTECKPLTAGNDRRKNPAEIAVSDHNRSRRLTAIRRLERLLKLVESADFKGHVAIKIHAAAGRIGGIQFKVLQHEPD